MALHPPEAGALDFVSAEFSPVRFNDLRFLVAVLSDLNTSSCLLKLFFSNRSRYSCSCSITRSFFIGDALRYRKAVVEQAFEVALVVEIGDGLKT
jgi:hypothetical protein